jgi:hypothetical protein
MNGKDFNPLLSLFHTYLSLEKEILKRVSKISNPFCFKCQTKCCEEKICRYGKPLVCYEFFCEQILINKNFQASNIQQTIKEFILIGNRAYGNTHLICVDNLSSISPKKIFKISYQIGKLMEKLANETVAPDRKYRPA